MRASASFVCIACLYQPRKWLTTHNIRTALLTDIELGVIIGKVEILRVYIFSHNLIHFFKLLQNKIYWLTSAEKVAMWGIWSTEAIVPTLPLYLYFLVLLARLLVEVYIAQLVIKFTLRDSTFVTSQMVLRDGGLSR